MTRELLATALACLASYVGNPLSMWLAIHRKPAGWWIVAATQALLAGFVFVALDWRFGGQVLCFLMGCYGVWRWQIKREHEPAIGGARRADLAGLMDDPVVRQVEAVRVARYEARSAAHESPRWRHLQELHRESAHRIANALPYFPAVAQEAPTAAIPPPRREDAAAARARRVRMVAEDALAALNHFDRAEAVRLRERLNHAD